MCIFIRRHSSIHIGQSWANRKRQIKKNKLKARLYRSRSVSAIDWIMIQKKKEKKWKKHYCLWLCMLFYLLTNRQQMERHLTVILSPGDYLRYWMFLFFLWREKSAHCQDSIVAVWREWASDITEPPPPAARRPGHREETEQTNANIYRGNWDSVPFSPDTQSQENSCLWDGKDEARFLGIGN